MSGALLLLLSWLLSVHHATCCSTPSPPPGALPPSCPKGTAYKSVCSFGCKPGYYGSGAMTMTCTFVGLWTTSGSCTVVSCGVPSTPSNAFALSVTSVTYGATYAFTCMKGFAGGGSVSCSAAGKWTQSGACTPTGLVVRGRAYHIGTDYTAVIQLKLVERNQFVTTDKNGYFALGDCRAGEKITLSWPGLTGTIHDSVPMATATVTVPPGGLPYAPSGVVMQQFATPLANIIKGWMKLTRQYIPLPKTCVFIATITAKGKTFLDFPHGMAGVVASLSPALPNDAAHIPYYFAVNRALGEITWVNNPFSPLKVTTVDGGVLFPNVPVSTQPYTLTATKPGYTFTTSTMYCLADGMIVNAAPGNGPTVLTPTEV